MPFIEAIDEHFPEAMKGNYLTLEVNDELRALGFTPENTVFANSTCADEINRFVTNFGEYWGENFDLGGLAGLPFRGKSGFGAYSHHIPENGNLFILYAAHVGVSEKGEWGKVRRKGMKKDTTSCGALTGALGLLEKDPAYQHPADPDDPEMPRVIEVVRGSLPSIQKAEIPVIEATEEMYKAVDGWMNRIIGFDAHSDYQNIALLGGIQINTPPGDTDYFLVKNFSVLNRDGTEKDLKPNLQHDHRH
ncbi:hypothetical protein ACFL1B_02205 [Nanoarchaeota archaeon]